MEPSAPPMEDGMMGEMADEMVIMLDIQRQFTEVYKGANGVFIGAANQQLQQIPPGIYGDLPLYTINQYDATTYMLNTMQAGFTGTNNPYGVRQLYNAGASDNM